MLMFMFMFLRYNVTNNQSFTTTTQSPGFYFFLTAPLFLTTLNSSYRRTEKHQRHHHHHFLQIRRRREAPLQLSLPFKTSLLFFSSPHFNSASMEEEEEEEEEGGEEAYYYEALDRILSSASASSSTVSEDDDETDSNFSKTLRIPKFPVSVSNYDIWVSEPLPIQERRKRLLHEMGLSNDPLLSRRDGEVSRSVSSDHVKGKSGEYDDPNCFVLPSISDGATTSNSPALPCSSFSSSLKQSIERNLIENQRNLSSGSSIGNGIVNNKPPTGRISNRMEEIRPNSLIVNPKNLFFSGAVDNSNGGVLENNADCNGITGDFYKIKNLDDGKEFVVNGIRKDGKWNKVREIESGQQLTMEEFERRVGHSPIVQELMRRQSVEGLDCKKDGLDVAGNGDVGGELKPRKKGSWFRSFKNVAGAMAGHRERRSSDERDNLSEKGGRRSSSATDDSQDISFHFHEKVRVRQYGKSWKELTALYKDQEIQAHNGSIWSIKFSLDGQYLASAGEDCVIHVWKVMELERKGELLMQKSEYGNLNSCFLSNESPEPTLVSSISESHLEKKRRGRTSISRKSGSVDHVVMPDSVFALSEKPTCSFRGHHDDVLDLSWSRSQYLLSSSMDKTVRLWHMASKSCLKIFSHSDYVTCIQFNPVDDRYFISGSLDAKVRIWSIPDRKVVDWSDVHEMVTAACYTPDGQSALVGSNKGSCILYNTCENKLQHISRIDLQNKKKRSHLKKITGFQFAPGSSSEVLITSADSRIRVVNAVDLVHKLKGFRNTNSQISASLTSNGKYVICASEDSHVYVWNHEDDPQPSRNKGGISVTHSYENFHCRNVSVAIPWPGIGGSEHNGLCNRREKISSTHLSSSPIQEPNRHREAPSLYGRTNGALGSTVSSLNSSYLLDRLFLTWPEEKLTMSRRTQSLGSLDISAGVKQDASAWGMVIVTANLKGEIKIFQNFGLPVRI